MPPADPDASPRSGDSALPVGFGDAQYAAAIQLGSQAKQAFGQELMISGHSLGGGLAAASAMVNDVPAVTYNAAGINDRTLEREGLDASAAKAYTADGLIRGYHVKNELLTHLQEDSIPLKCALPDAAGHLIQLPDPDPLSFGQCLLPWMMLKHRLDLHGIDSVIKAQDLASQSHAQTQDHALPTGSRLFNNEVVRLDGSACTTMRSCSKPPPAPPCARATTGCSASTSCCPAATATACSRCRAAPTTRRTCAARCRPRQRPANRRRPTSVSCSRRVCRRMRRSRKSSSAAWRCSSRHICHGAGRPACALRVHTGSTSPKPGCLLWERLQSRRALPVMPIATEVAPTFFSRHIAEPVFTPLLSSRAR